MSVVSRRACTASSEASQCAKDESALRSVGGAHAGTSARGSCVGASAIYVGSLVGVVRANWEVKGKTYLWWGLFASADSIVKARVAQDRLVL